jgi:hypothetical protein
MPNHPSYVEYERLFNKMITLQPLEAGERIVLAYLREKIGNYPVPSEVGPRASQNPPPRKMA